MSTGAWALSVAGYLGVGFIVLISPLTSYWYERWFGHGEYDFEIQMCIVMGLVWPLFILAGIARGLWAARHLPSLALQAVQWFGVGLWEAWDHRRVLKLAREAKRVKLARAVAREVDHG